MDTNPKQDVKPNTSSAVQATTTDVKPQEASSASGDVKQTALAEVKARLAAKGTESSTDQGSLVSEVNKTENEAQEGEQKDANEKEDVSVEDKDKKDAADKLLADGTDPSKPVPYERFKQELDKVKTFEPEATQYRSIETFCQSNRISPEQFNGALQVAAAINRGDYAEVQKMLGPVLDAMATHQGIKLPDDLAKLVADGELGEERARAWAKDRAATEQAKKSTQLSQADLTKQREQDTIKSVHTAVSAWVDSKVKSDPSFKPKAAPNAADGLFELCLAKFEQYCHTIPMNSINDVVAHYEKAYQDVLGFRKSLMPTKATTKKPLSSSASSINTETDTTIKDTTKPGWGKGSAARVIASLSK